MNKKVAFAPIPYATIIERWITKESYNYANIHEKLGEYIFVDFCNHGRGINGMTAGVLVTYIDENNNQCFKTFPITEIKIKRG